MSYYFESRPLPIETKQHFGVSLLGFDDEFYSLLIETYGLIGKLDGMCRFIPNTDFYAKLLMIQESCASCELEGISTRFYGFFDGEEIAKGSQLPLNLLSAMRYAQDGTFSESFVRKIHGVLVTAEVIESKYRENQGGSFNDLLWSYNAGSNPVPSSWISTAMKDMQKYVANVSYQEALVIAAKIQYQFEILDPFNKYSRIIARVIVMLILRWGGLLSYPVLGLSRYFVDTKIEYKDRLIAAYKSGEELLNVYWTKFFLKAVNTSVKNTINIIESLENARQTHMEMLPQIGNGNKSTTVIYEYIADTIIINVRQISDTLRLSFSNVTKVVKSFEEAGILRQVTQKERYRQFGYTPVLNLIEYR